MSYLKRWWWVGGLLLLLAGIATRAAADEVVCPKGFDLIPSGLACAAKNLAGADGAYSGLTAPVTSGRCPAGFERPPGVSFCIATRLTVNAIGHLPILEAETSRFCPEGFHRQPGSSICIASNLTLTLQGGSAALGGSTVLCPVGFYRPVGSTICVAANEQAATDVLELPVGPRCPPGFHRPPGVSICIPHTIVYGSTVPQNVVVPSGICPQNWQRPSNVRFCVPSRRQLPGGPAVIDDIVTKCPAGTVETWFDVPVYDADGLFVIDYVPTSYCVPEDLPPAG